MPGARLPRAGRRPHGRGAGVGSGPTTKGGRGLPARGGADAPLQHRVSAILALDQGTTGSSAIVVDETGKIRGSADREIRQFYPASGHVEHDPVEILATTVAVGREALARAGLEARKLTAMGITNQRETTVVWERDTGRPIHPAVVWQSRASAAICDRLRAAGHDKLVRDRSGVVAEAEARHFGAVVPIAGIAGDQQAALFGQTCFAAGEAKNTYGTGCFLLVNTGDRAAAASGGLLATVAWDIGDGLRYALEGSAFITGAAVQWLRDGLGIIAAAAETEALAASLSGNDNGYLVPAFTGLGAPHWDMYARGLLIGIERGTTRAHVARATLESIAYQTRDLIEAMRGAGQAIEVLRVDGGGTTNGFLMQFQADIAGIPVEVAAVQETAGRGAGVLAGLATGVWKTPDELRRRRTVSARYKPRMSADERDG